LSAPHLVVVISGHGYGHLGQTAPVINALGERLPSLRLTVRSRLPNAVLRRRIHGTFRHLEDGSDFGMVMRDALTVDVQASAARYAEFHTRWAQRVDAEALQLEALAPDLVLSNVAYLPLAGAARAGIPAMAMCSLNWADIYRHYCGPAQDSARVLHDIESAYQDARRFLRLKPGMPMHWLDNAQDLEPVSSRGKDSRNLIRDKLGLGDADRIALVSMGGIAHPMALQHWPSLPGIHWLVPAAVMPARPDMHAVEDVGLAFVDVLASSDALLTKPGYGNFVEAASHGVGVLYVRRRDWPEEAWLVSWLREHARSQEIQPQSLASGILEQELQRLLVGQKSKPSSAEGASRAADYLSGLLGGKN
jgi:hypothetical protein